ncbi:MAG: hypothetical protein M5U09_18165 [Gammaproteobacteria bacterium]|nr:hypothetical protein [Gammaproteobacteria bacterium]
MQQPAALVQQQVVHADALPARFVDIRRLVERHAGVDHEGADREGLVDEHALERRVLRVADQPRRGFRGLVEHLLRKLADLLGGRVEKAVAEQVRGAVPAAAVVLVVAELEGDLPGHEPATDGPRLVPQRLILLLVGEPAEALEREDSGVVPKVRDRLVTAEGGEGDGDAVHDTSRAACARPGVTTPAPPSHLRGGVDHRSESRSSPTPS